jgi:hypothetical protein
MIAPTAAMEVLLELHVKNGTRLRQGCRLRCTQQCRPKSTSFGHTHTHTQKFLGFEAQLILQMGSDSMLLRYEYHSHSQPSSRDKCKWQNGFNPEKQGAWSRSKTNKGTGAAVYRWGSRRGQCFSLGLHTTEFHAAIYAINPLAPKLFFFLNFCTPCI